MVLQNVSSNNAFERMDKSQNPKWLNDRLKHEPADFEVDSI